MSIDQPPLGANATLDLAPTRAEAKSMRRQWYMAAVLTLLYIYAQIDGSAIIILVTPIKQDLGVSDTEMSLLLGLSFAAFYSILGLPAGYLVDRIARRKVMGVGIVLWSAMTMSCGLASTYWQLFLARCGVGIGEAFGLYGAIHFRYHQKERRPTAATKRSCSWSDGAPTRPTTCAAPTHCRTVWLTNRNRWPNFRNSRSRAV